MRKHLGLFLAVGAAWGTAVACGGTTTITGPASTGPTNDAATACPTEPCDGAGGDAGTDFSTPTVCTSNTTWTRGDRGSASMHPGVACIDCHDATGGPSFSIAGTVFPTAHEPDDCNGTKGGVQVVITDATGTVTTLTVNSVGNFYGTARIRTPFHAKVVAAGKERTMVAAQTVGDCNSCHTVDGASSAPGRIVAP